ncbi:MAG: protein kinase [Anaerolineae bacterium]|nr:protein kinase [Anaerolineae bacterium]NUQ02776.1 protein kinase [Anaerolineae bacterium]
MGDVTQARLGRYELRERIGAGGTARVYKAYDPTLGRLVAIKVLYEHLAEDATFQERFEREAKIIAAFNHPNIVQVFDFSVEPRAEGALCYMVMSYIPGMTLRTLLEETARRGESLPNARILSIMRDIAAALGYAHEHGMVHRDVKPGNVIIRDDGRAILTDFGIARILRTERLTQQGVTTGTPIYMSPEQAAGEPGDARSDLYSLGIILFEMMTGSPPFNDDNNLSVMLKHLNTPIPRLSALRGTISAKADAFFSRALAKNPSDRFQTASELAAALAGLFPEPQDDVTNLLPATNRSAAAPPRAGVGERGKHTSLAIPLLTPRTPTAGIIALVGVAAVLIVILLMAVARNGVVSPEIQASVDSVPSMTGDIYFTSTFASDDPFNEYWLRAQTNALDSALTPQGLLLENPTPNTAATRIFGMSTSYEDISIAMNAQLVAGSQRASAYGIVFHYQDEDNYCVFAVDGVGRFSIWTRAAGVWRELRGGAEHWTESSTVKPTGETNNLAVTVLNGEFTAYVNNRRVTRVSDSTFTGGQIGIYIASDNGDARVLVERYRVFSSVPSMTSPSG